MNNPFDHFDKIVCICGQHEPERWEQVQKEFERIGILDRIERFDEVIDSTWLTETYGETSEWSKTDYCHWKIISDAHEDGLKNVFIFESDIHFIDTDLEKMLKSIESLEDVDWKLFYMGGIPHNVYEVHNESLINVSMCQAHAYAINGKHCKEVAEKLMEGKIAIDQVYKREKQFGLGRSAYATHPRFVVQEDENIQTRKQYSNIMWQRAIEPMIEMYNHGIEFVTMTAICDGTFLDDCWKHSGPHTQLLNNFKKSMDNVGMPASNGFVKIHHMNYVEFEKLELIHNILKRGKICFYSDPDIVFLKNPMEYLYNLLEDYDLIVQSGADDSKRKLKAFKKVLHPGFCIVKPTELTLRLFDTSTKFHWPNEDDESHLEYLYRWQQYRVDSIYFNSKLNSDEDYQKNLKIKILDEDEFCLSKNYTSTNDNAYIVHYNESDRKVLHPKNKIGRMKENNHWFIK